MLSELRSQLFVMTGDWLHFLRATLLLSVKPLVVDKARGIAWIVSRNHYLRQNR